MAKMNDIRFLARETAKEVSGSPRDWMRYLDTASRLYRYPFADTLLIHAQRPDAMACAELEVWNEKMRRWGNRGAKGIALIDDTGPRRVLRYVFDVSDTHPVRGGRTPYLWRLKEDQREMLLNHLTDTYGLNGEMLQTCPLRCGRLQRTFLMAICFRILVAPVVAAVFVLLLFVGMFMKDRRKKKKGKR